MTDKDAVLKEKVEHSGLFDFAGFYSFAHSWFKEQKYGVNEKKYSEKVKGNARDLRIEWAATKAISDYFKIELDITFEVWGMTEVEVEIDGEKKKMNKGTIGAEIKGTLVKDYDSKWEIPQRNIQQILDSRKSKQHERQSRRRRQKFQRRTQKFSRFNRKKISSISA